MGIDTNIMRFLLASRAAHVSFQRTACIGRQALYTSHRQLLMVFEEFGLRPEKALSDPLLRGGTQFAEPFLRYLGAEEIVSLDASDFEGADITHDMNHPIGQGLKERFDVVFDGGTLEHIFNFPTAATNCMEMVQLGGHFIGCSPANNMCGHGFYQFSPELYFRLFSAANGFRIRRLVLVEKVEDAEWFAVSDPAELRSRIQIANEIPLYMFVLAKRESIVSIFDEAPQQSDYVAAWNLGSDGPGGPPSGPPTIMGRAMKTLASMSGLSGLAQPIRHYLQRRALKRIYYGGLRSSGVRRVRYTRGGPLIPD
jgi:hypothetical protein